MKKILALSIILLMLTSSSVNAQSKTNPSTKTVKLENPTYDTISYEIYRHIVIREFQPKDNLIMEFGLEGRTVKATVGMVKEINKKLDEPYAGVSFYLTKKNGSWYLTDYYIKRWSKFN